jgi:hypothetical protein
MIDELINSLGDEELIMTYLNEYKTYCKRVERNIHLSTWDRILLLMECTDLTITTELQNRGLYGSALKIGNILYGKK